MALCQAKQGKASMEIVLRIFPRLKPNMVVPFLGLMSCVPIGLLTLSLSKSNSILTAPIFCLMFVGPIVMMGWGLYSIGKTIESLDQVYPFFRSKIFYACLILFVVVYIIYMPPLLNAPSAPAR